jgi:metal-responsive CopG/Arc/MetJ family transcriptional regulator
MKVQVSLDDKLVERIDKYAESNYMSRSGVVSFATSQFLNQNEVLGLVKDMSLAMRKIADTGDVSDDALRQLEDFERTIKILTTSRQ